MSKGSVLVETTTELPQVAPPSKERLKTMAFAPALFHATYTSPLGPTKGTAPMERPGPLFESTRVVVKVALWSEERASRTPSLLEPPLAASQAT
jgi:hypothetical protein